VGLTSGIFPIAAGRSKLGEVHPAIKVFWLVSFTALPLVSTSLILQLCVLAGVLVTSVLGGVGLTPLRSLKALGIPIGLIFALNLVLTRSVGFAASMGVRLITMASAAYLFFAVTDPMEIADLLTMIKTPPGVALAAMVAFRFIPVMIDDLKGIMAAQRSRGYRSDVGGALERIRRLSPILIPALVLVVRRSQSVAEAVESRGFGSGKRTLYPDYRMTRSSYLLLLWSILPWAAVLLI